MLDWKGELVINKTFLAAGRAVDRFLSGCVIRSKGRVPFRTGTLQRSLQMRGAVRTQDAVVGAWGSFSVRYALPVETGTRAHIIYNGFGRGIRINHPGTLPHPYLMNTWQEMLPGFAGILAQEYAAA
jgi:hypothetical protein